MDTLYHPGSGGGECDRQSDGNIIRDRVALVVAHHLFPAAGQVDLVGDGDDVGLSELSYGLYQCRSREGGEMWRGEGDRTAQEHAGRKVK